MEATEYRRLTADVGAIEIEIGIAIAIEGTPNGTRTREIGRLPAGDRLRSLGLRESRDAGRHPSCGAGPMATCQSNELDRMAAMLSRLGGRGYQVREETSAYDGNSIDPDPDSDLDEDKPQQRGGGDGIPPPHR